jgi:excisionase family DNA binding protein
VSTSFPDGRKDQGQTLVIALRLSDEDIARIAERTAALLARKHGGGTPPSPYLTISEAAEYLRCRRQRIDDLLSQRRLSRVKDGARTLILRAELEAYLVRDTSARSPDIWESAA